MYMLALATAVRSDKALAARIGKHPSELTSMHIVILQSAGGLHRRRLRLGFISDGRSGSGGNELGATARRVVDGRL